MPMVFMFIATGIHIPMCWLFMYTLDMGIVGLGLARSLKDLYLAI